MDLIFDGKIFKQFRNSIYYLSKNGEVFSMYTKRIIKCLIRNTRGKQYKYVDVWNEKTGKQQHINVHRMVYIAWRGEIPNGVQVNHKNDDSLDNRLENLYIGVQQDNIFDCINNGHRVGNVFYLTILDKKINQVMTFCPASDFIEYCGHSSKNGSVSKFFNKNWFNKRYEIVEFKKVSNLEEYKSLRSVTTTPDECREVG